MRLEFEELTYDVDEAKFGPGRSFFLPCLAPQEARPLMERAMKRRKYVVLTKIVIEEGISGLRVWRVC